MNADNIVEPQDELHVMINVQARTLLSWIET